MAGINLHLHNTVDMILVSMFKYIIFSWTCTKYYYFGKSTDLQIAERLPMITTCEQRLLIKKAFS